MHPDVSRALAAERVKDMRARAAARDLASAVRHRHRHHRASPAAAAVAEAPRAHSPARQAEPVPGPVLADSMLAGSIQANSAPGQPRPAPEPAHAGAQPGHPASCA